MDFWSMECAIRGGPTLTHVHDESAPQVADHGDCPCAECGLTPNRWAHLIRGMPETKGKVVEPQMRQKMPKDEYVIVLDAPTRTRLLRYVAAVEDRRGYR